MVMRISKSYKDLGHILFLFWPNATDNKVFIAVQGTVPL